jgi:hypothetical protein
MQKLTVVKTNRKRSALGDRIAVEEEELVAAVVGAAEACPSFPVVVAVEAEDESASTPAVAAGG